MANGDFNCKVRLRKMHVYVPVVIEEVSSENIFGSRRHGSLPIEALKHSSIAPWCVKERRDFEMRASLSTVRAQRQQLSKRSQTAGSSERNRQSLSAVANTFGKHAKATKN